MLCGIDLMVVSQEVLMNLTCKMCSEIILLQLLPRLPGPNELIVLWFVASHFLQVKWQSGLLEVNFFQQSKVIDWTI